MSQYSGAAVLERPQTQPVRVGWSGNPWSLTGLCFLNALLILLTIGIYWFWARTEYRRHMWRMVRVEGEPLEYTGTGRELLIGYLLLFVMIILPALVIVKAVQLYFGPQSPVTAAITMVLYIGFFFLYFAGVFRANRYLLSRTRWRGIAFGVAGNAGAYAWMSIWTALLAGLTLLWTVPWRTTALRRRLTKAMYFGSARFRFEGGSGSLYQPFAILWIGAALICLAIVLVVYQPLIAAIQAAARQPGGKIDVQLPPQQFFLISLLLAFFVIFSSWYEARKLNHFAQATRIDGLSGGLSTTARGIIWLTLSNFFLLVFTLGILRPVTQARRLRYLTERFVWEGAAGLADVARGQEQAGLQGAGLEAAFSIDIF